MKIAGKFAIFTAVLCALAATVCAGFCFGYWNRVHGKYGRNLDFRVSAMTTAYFDPFNRAPEGPDVFSVSQAREIEESGQAPAGFTWLPVSKFYLVVTGGGIEPRGITRVTNGQEFLLVANRPEMMLTHSADKPAWGAKSVEMTSTTIYGPVVKRVQIDFDDTGKDLLRQFTEKYVRHSISVDVDGQVIASMGLLTPIKRGGLGLTFPEGAEVVAGKLRDSLTSEQK
ncbi:MAG: hypothetical protein ACLP07_14125 [Terracidiphilus sp.]